MSQFDKAGSVKRPKVSSGDHWNGYTSNHWKKKDKKEVTILYNFVERRKSFFLRAFFERNGYKYKDLGDHILEDVRWGKEFGNRMECNPMYFTSGSLLRNLFIIQEEKNFTKEEIVEKYVFLGGGGQCGPCRYGMYPQEYWKALNDAGFKGFRVIVFSSGFTTEMQRGNSALPVDLKFRVNMAMAFILSDFLHIAECALRPYAKNKKTALRALARMERILLDAFCSRWWWFALPRALKRVGKLLHSIPRKENPLPLIYVTGEFFANLAHNEGNYNLRRFIMDEGCEVYPGLFTNRVMYDFWRQERVFRRELKYEKSIAKKMQALALIITARCRSLFVKYLYNKLKKVLRPELFGGRADLYDLHHLARLGHEYYHPEIFGGEGNLEVAEAVYYSDLVDGFISAKPFGCLTSSGISDGIQAKVMARFPQLNFLSIETSGDNEVGILSRVSMLLFKAKQRHWMRVKGKRRDDTA
ncbi:MAG: hypothetical protein GF401_06945, partial [Chitinivibrionales bacterium]|nr:hypothetical protein [Chitinivibrionales bacterium]